ncbi:hypothetical protein F5148DRAFT_1150427 [Russula earlei]|uniref:Uncharacterized protein n=1 Tax=Russula earlei TaxID=71964 RepID=A0ACC0U4E3_9AGAM|nr:hypothetical protein F5148DRAFT_1150427 [Russula earlei]
MQDVIFALFDTLPSHTSSMTSSHLRDEDSSGERHNYERPQTHAYHVRIHELGDVMLRPLLRGFVSSEKVSYTLVPPLLSYHSAPSVLPTSASSTPSIQAHPKSAPPSVCLPSNGTSPATCALVTWDSSLWPYPRAPLDDITELNLNFADTGDLSDVDAFRTATAEQQSVAKKDRAKEREEIERSWDVHGGFDTSIDASPLHTALGWPSCALAHTVISGSGSAAPPSP